MKRKIVLTIIAVCCCLTVNAQLKSETNECFELTSIVFRLANANEYVNNELQKYSEDIDNYFSPFRNHDVIAYATILRDKYGISYDAVASAAAAIEIHKGAVRIKSNIRLSSSSQNIDSRWTETTFKKFVKLLNDFYKKSKFHKFYTSHADIYKIACERIDASLSTIDTTWFERFFGETLPQVSIIVSLSNGKNNYAYSITDNNSEQNANGIVIGAISDGAGLPAYSRFVVYTVVHELSHLLSNKKLNIFWSEIEPAASMIFSNFEKFIQNTPYGNAHICMTEWFNNLCSITYFKENPQTELDINILLAIITNKGFIWMNRTSSLMDYFLKYRTIFPTINDFRNQIIGFINYTADDFEQIIKEYQSLSPYIIDVFPINGSTVPNGIEEITFKFSIPMQLAASLQSLEGENGMDLYPLIIKDTWIDEYTYVLYLDKMKLEPGKTYGLKLDRRYFVSMEYYSMNNDYILKFKVE